jgi:hypothetical protein
MKSTEYNLRRLIRETLVTEITKLPKEYFKTIDDAIQGSAFWKEPNSPDDVDVYDHRAGTSLGTPAVEALQSALQDVFDSLELDIDVAISSHETDDLENYSLHPDHPAYPNRWLIDAKWYVSKQNPGRNTVDMEVMTASESLPDLDPAALVRHIAQTVRHELVHWTQMKKQASNKGGLTDTEAFEEMLNDPKQVPHGDKSTVADYLHAHIEIDAHAHDGAEELLAVYGEDGAKDILRGNIDLSDPRLPNTLKHYHEVLPKGDPTIKKLYGKIYSYIKYFSE